jgi:polyhydroxyalkanoate synthesis regulator phasin
MRKKLVLVGSFVAAIALAGVAVAGVVLAQSPSPSPGQSGGGANAPATAARQQVDSFLNALAQNLGISRSTLDNALKTTAKQQVDQAVSAGKLTQQQASQIDQRIDNGQFPFGLGRFFGRGRGFGDNGAAATGVRSCLGAAQQAVTSTLGISSSDLKQARRNGESIAQIAQDHGTTLQALQSAVTSAVQPCLDQQVQAGTITASQEQSLLQRLQQRLSSEGSRPGNQGQPRGGNAGDF